METKNDNLSPQQSLDLIASMINQAKGNVGRSSFYFLLWGWLIAFCNFGMYIVLTFTDYGEYAPSVWLLCIPAWAISAMYGRRESKTKMVQTHLDKISMWVWICMAIVITPAWVFGGKINWTSSSG